MLNAPDGIRKAAHAKGGFPRPQPTTRNPIRGQGRGGRAGGCHHHVPLVQSGTTISTTRVHVMKDDIHPKYHPKATITCACGVAFVVGSTMPEIHVELCSACHPFYTGKQKMMDTARRVDRFQRRAELQTTTAASRVGRRVKKERNVARRKAKSEALGAEK